jgi:pyridoxamine 5'-phosphate oxidase
LNFELMKKLLAEYRKEYMLGGLRRRDLLPDALRQFEKWFEAAVEAGVVEPTVMTLATASRHARPSARTVLLKGVDVRGFTFFTNYESRKGRELDENGQAALVIYWKEVERQVCVAGTVVRVSREESDTYFKSRPLGSRLAAWVSPQTEVIESRAILEERLRRVTERYPAENVPLPPSWGGYVVAPETIEFWQGRPSRLHDRFLYTRQSDGSWRIDRLAP